MKMKKRNRWIFVGAGVLALLLAGLIYALSVISKPIGASHLNWTAAQLSLTFTLAMVFFCIGNLLSGGLSKKVNPRLFVICSALCFLVGFLTASMTQDSLRLLYIGFGVLCGLGAGFAYNTIMSTVCSWFPDRHGMVSGILLMGFGLSSFIIGKIYTAATPSNGSMGWCVTFRFMGIIIFVIMVICSLFFVRPDADFVPPSSGNKKILREPASDIPVGKMVRTRSFWMFYIWIIMTSAAGLALVSQASGIAVQVGPQVSDGTIATVVGLISIMNGIGRVIYGTMYDKKGYRFTMTVDIVSFAITALILIMALSATSFTLLIIGFLVGGFSYGGVTPIGSAFTSDFYGRTHYAVNFSVIISNGIISSFASTIAGRLFDLSHSYMSTIFMMLGVTAVSLIVFLLIRRPVPVNGGR